MPREVYCCDGCGRDTTRRSRLCLDCEPKKRRARQDIDPDLREDLEGVGCFVDDEHLDREEDEEAYGTD